MIYYSPHENGFYLKEIHGDNIPSDKIEITEEYHEQLLKLQQTGKQIKPNENNFPVAVDREIPPLTWDDIRIKRNFLLTESDWTVCVDSKPKPSKQDWLNYRQSLRDITTVFSSAENVVWPIIPE
jgi:hypothetical protein